jgi:hypothetical protein
VIAPPDASLTKQWLIFLTAVVTFLTPLSVAILAIINKRASNRAEASAKQAAEKAEVVKTTLETSTDKTEKKLDQIHTLVNSTMGVQLDTNATDKERIADLTKHPKDINAATIARALSDEHNRKQALVDATLTH